MTADARHNLVRAYREIGAGGFSRVDGTIEFYTRVNALVGADMIVLDIGAGRGAQLLNADSPYRARLQSLQGRVKRLVAVDVDEAVKCNRFVDEAHVIAAGEPLPFADSTFDLAYADWVLEHVQEPGAFADNVYRVLKPGGWFCARTPNRWGITGLGSNLIPNRMHSRLLRTLQPAREEQDVFPTVYKLNTRRSIRRHFPAGKWDDFSYFYNSEPPYVQWSRLLLAAADAYQRLAPAALATNIHIFLRRK